jgi:Transcription elongation factor
MNTIQITQSDYNRLQDLLRDARPETAEDQRCREALFQELMRAKIKPPDEIPTDVITLGSRARLRDLESGDVLEYTLVLPVDADVEAGRISILAPLGTAMLGFRRGDEIEWMMPGGKVKLRVEEVFQPETAGNIG